MFFSLCCKINYEPLEGNIIDLPSSILGTLINEEKTFPYFFRMVTECGMETYVGVREFTSENEEFVISYILAESLCLTENQIVDFYLLENVLKGKFIKLEPLERNFFDLPNYEDILEDKLSKYPILSQNQIIVLNVFDTNYSFKILTVDQNWDGVNLEEDNFEYDCIDIIDTDIEVDIYNRFLEEEYYERLRQEALEKEREENERTMMNIEDVNLLTIGNRLGGSSLVRNEDVRLARIAKFKK